MRAMENHLAESDRSIDTGKVPPRQPVSTQESMPHLWGTKIDEEDFVLCAAVALLRLVLLHGVGLAGDWEDTQHWLCPKSYDNVLSAPVHIVEHSFLAALAKAFSVIGSALTGSHTPTRTAP
eukprot:Selendium_serpulae@DN6360_c0_g2_i2.p3